MLCVWHHPLARTWPGVNGPRSVRIAGCPARALTNNRNFDIVTFNNNKSLSFYFFSNASAFGSFASGLCGKTVTRLPDNITYYCNVMLKDRNGTTAESTTTGLDYGSNSAIELNRSAM